VRLPRPGVLALGLWGDGERGFVGLDDAADAADRGRGTGIHGQPNAMAEEPSGFHAAIQHPLNLTGRNALFAGAHQVNDLKPQMQGKVRGLENGPHSYGERLGTLVALMEPSAGGLAGEPLDASAVRIAAMGASRTTRPKMRFDIGESGVFALEVRGIEDGLRHGE